MSSQAFPLRRDDYNWAECPKKFSGFDNFYFCSQNYQTQEQSTEGKEKKQDGGKRWQEQESNQNFSVSTVSNF